MTFQWDALWAYMGVSAISFVTFSVSCPSKAYKRGALLAEQEFRGAIGYRMLGATAVETKGAASG